MTSYLEKLPLELRQIIYGHTLDVVFLQANQGHQLRYHDPPTPLFVNKQMRAEYMACLYKLGIFSTFRVFDAIHWESTVIQTDRIRHLHVGLLDIRTSGSAFLNEIRENFPSLQQLFCEVVVIDQEFVSIRFPSIAYLVRCPALNPIIIFVR